MTKKIVVGEIDPSRFSRDYGPGTTVVVTDDASPSYVSNLRNRGASVVVAAQNPSPCRASDYISRGAEVVAGTDKGSQSYVFNLETRGVGTIIQGTKTTEDVVGIVLKSRN